MALVSLVPVLNSKLGNLALHHDENINSPVNERGTGWRKCRPALVPWNDRVLEPTEEAIESHRKLEAVLAGFQLCLMPPGREDHCPLVIYHSNKLLTCVVTIAVNHSEKPTE